MSWPLPVLCSKVPRNLWRRALSMPPLNPFALSAAKGLTPSIHQTLRCAQGERGLEFLALRAFLELRASRPLLALRLPLAFRSSPALLRRCDERVGAV